MQKSRLIYKLLIVIILCIRALTGTGQNNFIKWYLDGEKSFLNADFEQANLHFQNAISAFSQKEDSIVLGKCYLYLGKLFGKLGNLTRSEEYVLASRDIFDAHNNDTLLIQAYNLLGNIRGSMGDIEEAINQFMLGLKIADSLNLDYIHGSILINLGSLHTRQSQFAKAIDYFNEGKQIGERIQSKYGISMSLIGLGTAYKGLKNYELSIQNYLSGIKFAKQINDLYILQNAYELISETYASVNDYKSAHKYLSLFINLKDSIGSSQINQRIIELETKYNTQRKESEILELRAVQQANEITQLKSAEDIKLLRYQLGVIGFSTAVIIIVAFIIFRQYKKKLALSMKLRQNKEELENRNVELMETLSLNNQLQGALKHDLENYKQLAYRKQMNPHFIFNSLNSIQNYILTNDKIQANYYLGELATLIRRILENSEKELISLKEELFVCDTYIKLEQKRFEGKFEYSFKNEAQLDLSKIQIPPLLLQPFIENAIWHGLLHKSNDALLKVTISKGFEDTVLISIHDNGVGRGNSTESKKRIESKSESLGINLTMKRLELNNYLNASEISLQIKDLKSVDQTPTGTEVVFKLGTKI